MNAVPSISRRRCLAMGAGLGASLFGSRAFAAQQPNVVVELFSSQGCSSCPKGDKLLADLRDMPGVLALTFHVDYWDYLGWKDTLATPDFSQRQYDYAKARGDMDVFTPQMVLNGGAQAAGNQRTDVLAALEKSRVQDWPVPVTMVDGGKEIEIGIAAGQAGEEATLWVMPIRDSISVTIGKGEMAGREITYVNVVRKLIPAAMWNGGASRTVLPKDGLMTPDATGCVALLQKGKVGQVLGCAALVRVSV